MTDRRFVARDEIRSAFSTVMFAMYRDEVPAYDTLTTLVAYVNDETLAADATLNERLDATGRADFTQGVSAVFSYCLENGIALIPQSGNTGLFSGYTRPPRCAGSPRSSNPLPRPTHGSWSNSEYRRPGPP